MVKAYSLNKGHVDWLESEGKKSDRGASGELRKILDEERVRRTTGVAKDRLDSTLEISGVAVPVRLTDGDHSLIPRSYVDGVAGKAEKTLEPEKEVTRKATMGKFSGVTELAKKIAKDIPGVAVASEVSGLPLPVKFNKIMADEPRDGSLDQEGITDKMRKSAKKRPVETEGRVELVKGFWREEYPSEAEAKIKAAEMKWSEGEYEIKPVE